MFLAFILVALSVVDALRVPLSLTAKRYDGYKVLSAVPHNEETLIVLHRLATQDIRIDFWKEPSNVGSEVQLKVSPEDLSRVESVLKTAKIHFKTIIDDVQNMLTPMWKDLDRRSLMKNAFDLNNWNTLEDIHSWLSTLADSCRPGLTCELYSIGNSYEGRPLYVFKISKPGAGRRGYWIDGAIHAREWLSPATTINILNHLVTGGDADAIRLADEYDWYFLPVMNPDGYKYSFFDRDWRKNRRPNPGPNCSDPRRTTIGTDLNRNFDFRWGKNGVSFDPCSDQYCGPSGGSEPETQAVQAELVRLGKNLNAVVTVHSFGNMWMFPWGNTKNYVGWRGNCDLAEDSADMMVVANAIADAIQATYNTTWSRGNSCQVIYPTTGGTDDFAKGVAGVKYAFCPELRGSSFVPDPSEIALSFKEVWNGIVAMCDTIKA